MNAVEIEEAVAELIQQPYEPLAFITGFMAAYGASATTITRLKEGDGNTSDLLDGILWKKWVHFQPSAPGQTSDALDAIEASRKTAQGKVRYAITTDGNEFAARDLKTGEALFCPLPDLENRFGFFLPIAGIDRYEVADENPVDIKATGRLAKLYDALIAENPDWATDARRHDMNQFMTRVIFCLFAEDTGIFPDNIFSETLATRCSAHPENIAPTLETMFEVMNLNDKDGSRDGKPTWVCAFPYVNGGLFAGSLKVPEFDWMSWRYLRDAGKLDWKVINPDIFGSMIQSIVNTDERGELGMHYTSVPNILKVLNPLFLDGLREEVEAGWGSKAKLQAVLKRLMKIRVFDPACGSGNFLVIAYREMREIEIRVLKRLQELTGEMAGLWSHVELKNFYGIEIGDFAAETAKLALWIAQHQMNQKFEDAFGKLPPELPLRTGATVVCGNALRLDWSSVCSPPSAELETYIVGNPPYLGRQRQTNEQKQDKEKLFSGRIKNYKSLDYVSGWFLKCNDFVTMASGRSGYALVATNSICQGQHVSILWEKLLAAGVEIGFSHTSFAWKNNARNNAAVIVVIVGILKNVHPLKKKIYDNDLVYECDNITPYITSGRNVIVHPVSNASSNKPRMQFGNMALNGGSLIFDQRERDEFLHRNPNAEKYFRKLVGSEEFIRGTMRYCLWIRQNDLEDAASIPDIADRIATVQRLRLESSDAATRRMAEMPYRFREQHESHSYSLIVPRVSSDRRIYIPCGVLDSECIISDSAFAIFDAPLWTMSVISSKMHICWIRAVCGKLKGDYRYSNTIGWNTFPIPDLDEGSLTELAASAETIQLIRDSHFPSTIAEIYDPEGMPRDLLDAHRSNDEVIEKLYVGRTFKNDTERLEHLFKLYTKMVASKGKA
ncbi:hypothetical protein CHX26_04115 [Porphyrobacter sp. HT-58-2]|uniref:class I SAM-dependent DNA methyltransferase n=1 Tax=Porphyrobacter sp. HT-58-2 TaxID=2023229 RepID=UPI000CDBBC6C|nr:DNA methyltransferase [Porphyrobacter sp. HT-58-2]AUX68803.1 hypothetical protein CHX26_04115 [Porphyrobacter sp. HT-58-2]